jgi:hypothetical protein
VIGLLPLDLALFLEVEDEVLLPVLQDGLLHVPAAQFGKRDRRVDLGVLLAPGEEATQRDRPDDH